MADSSGTVSNMAFGRYVAEVVLGITAANDDYVEEDGAGLSRFMSGVL